MICTEDVAQQQREANDLPVQSSYTINQQELGACVLDVGSQGAMAAQPTKYFILSCQTKLAHHI